MHAFEETKIIPCQAKDFFDIVLDISAYPDFLPWVSRASVLSRTEHALTAELVASLAGKEYSFQTTDTFEKHAHIDIRLLNGPFKFLESFWSFENLGEHSCRVHFSIEFAFNSRMLDLIAAPIFSVACKSMVHSFEKRVQAIHGKLC
ncbi:MAG: type II toxin-antitoxin system RatA family toxin [Zetaproteobacteria bacterium]|nr:type II toxin-antitoxin system RatA family toxin [Zetaproteobacteria bacterium]